MVPQRRGAKLFLGFYVTCIHATYHQHLISYVYLNSI